MNILLSTAGRRNYMVEYFKNALHGKGLVHASNNILTYTLLKADKYFISPQIYDDNYITAILNYCIINEISLVVPLFDIDLPVLAKAKNLFHRYGIKIIVSDYEVTQICNDKWRSFKFLSEIGIKQPESYLSIEDTKIALLENKIKFPLIIKPRWGMGSIGIHKVFDFEEFNILYRKLRHEIFDTYLKHESS